MKESTIDSQRLESLLAMDIDESESRTGICGTIVDQT